MFACSFADDVVSLVDETHSITISFREYLYLNASVSTGVTRDLRWGRKQQQIRATWGKCSSTWSSVEAGNKTYDPRPVLVPSSITLRARCCMVVSSRSSAEKRTCGRCGSHGHTSQSGCHREFLWRKWVLELEFKKMGFECTTSSSQPH